MFRLAARSMTQARAFSAARVLNYPVFYTKSHEWVDIDGSKATLGVTHFAQEELGEVVYIDLPSTGATVEAGEDYGTVESVKATSSLVSPVSGDVTEVNEEVTENTGMINESPEDKAWLVKLENVVKPEEGLMTREEYDAYLQEQ